MSLLLLVVVAWLLFARGSSLQGGTSTCEDQMDRWKNSMRVRCDTDSECGFGKTCWFPFRLTSQDVGECSGYTSSGQRDTIITGDKVYALAHPSETRWGVCGV